MQPLHGRAGRADVVDVVDERAQEVMMLVAPFLRDTERLHLNTLSQAYVR